MRFPDMNVMPISHIRLTEFLKIEPFNISVLLPTQHESEVNPIRLTQRPQQHKVKYTDREIKCKYFSLFVKL